MKSNYFSTWNGVYYWKSINLDDDRGVFSKIVPSDVNEILGRFLLCDAFITESHPGVVRGMHLQIDSAAGTRLIHVIEGSINDVLMDLRIESASYREVSSQSLTSGGINTVLIPGGVAHGFEALTNAKLLYLSDKQYEPDKDTGFNPLSIGYEWATQNPIISKRDLNLPSFFKTKR